MADKMDRSAAQDMEEKALRARRVIIWAMAILMILPFILIWLTDSVRF